MFRHKDKDNKENKEKELPAQESAGVAKEKKLSTGDSGVEILNSDIKDLLEKNLKWSQIIYEQNRRINRKLLWSAIAGWVRLLLILVSLIFALLFLPPVIKNLWSQYGDLLGVTKSELGQNNGSLNELLKILNFSSEQKDQLKAIVK